MTLVPRSIQGRMLMLSGLATLVALAIAGVLIAGVLARFVTQGIDRRLDAELALVASAVATNGQIDRARLTRLRGALNAGPDWRWRIDAPGGSFGSDDLPVIEARPRPDPPGAIRGPEPADRARPIDGRDRAGEMIHARQLRVTTTGGPVLLTAAAPREVITRPVRGALVPLLATLALLGVVLAVAAVVQIRLGLKPVRRLRDAVGAIRSGNASNVATDQPAELQPLAEELDALVRDNDIALTTARASASNLAHALKTPVATLALELRGDPRAAQIARIDTTIRHHLARARSGAASMRMATLLNSAIEELGDTITRLHADRSIAIETHIPTGVRVAMDRADLDELAGNLIDNAVRHARSRVTVDARTEGRKVHLMITDDGPGIPATDIARATAPGVRLDERSDGHGFGLAIVRDLTELHGGTLTLANSTGGGLLAAVALPIAGDDG